MSEFHHTIDDMIWVRGNENARVLLRPIDYPEIRMPKASPRARGGPPPPPSPHLRLNQPGVELVYGDTVANFVLDFKQPYEGLPDGVDERIYRQGAFHALNRRNVGTVGGGPMPWFYGDQAIVALPHLLRAQQDRQPPPPDPGELPMILSRRQFFQIAAMKGMITQQEALDAVRTGVIPQLMQTGLDTLPPDQKFAAEMMLSGAGEFDRHHPLVEQFGQVMGLPPAALDQIWEQGMLL